MTVNYEFVSELPSTDAFETLMVEYYGVMFDKLKDAGGPELTAVDHAKGTISHIEELLPPLGRLLLATNDQGEILGCGVIRMIRKDAAELKRMYVRPKAQGLGIGRRLFEMRIAEARKMGCKYLYADTVKDNRAMLSMYEKFGFSYISRYPENANGPELESFLVYLEHEVR